MHAIRPLGFDLSGQDAVFIAVSEHIFNDCFNVFTLAAAFRESAAADRVGMNDLEIKGRCALLPFWDLATAKRR